MTTQQRPINNDEKVIIINSYAAGIPPRVIFKQIGKTVASIKMFYSRWKLNKDLPPKEKQNRSLIDGRMGMMIKNQVSETPILGLKKLGAKIKEKVSEGTWWDFCLILVYLHTILLADISRIEVIDALYRN